MKTQTILVTGGAGYIGSVVARQLADQGWDVVVIDAFVHRQTLNLPRVTVYAGNLSDHYFLNSIFRKHKPLLVIHCAGLIEVGRSVQHPASFYAANLSATLTLLDVMRAHDTKKIIFSSTSAVYGIPEKMPMSESCVIEPKSPYARSKHAVEYVLSDYAHAYGLTAVIFRYFNAAGALPEHNLGEQHNPETHVIPLMLEAFAHNKAFNLFGTDYPTVDGTCVRDYIHVHDVAKAHVLASCNDSLSGVVIINLGTGKPFSVLQLITAAERVCGRMLNVIPQQPRPGDVAQLVADAQRAKTLLGWAPERSSIDEIIETALFWQQRHSRRILPTIHQVNL